MVSVIWVSLPASWSLYNVQAGLQVIIAITCFVGVFVFARTCWQSSSLNLAKNRPVSLPALISIHTFSEAYDAVCLLRWRILHRKHWKILAQCMVVTLLSAATIVSGPIAKSSTRLGEVVRPVRADGLLANRGYNSLTNGYVQWNDTIQKLNNAGFPYDQLLDYLPDSRYNWVYKDNEWNSSWSMSCSTTDSTPVTITDTGVCTTPFTELAGVTDFFPLDEFSYWTVSPFTIYQGFSTTVALLVFTGWTPNLENVYLGVNNLSVTVAALMMNNLNSKSNANSTCMFDAGDVGSSSYTMAQCEVQKIRNVDQVDMHAAYPDHHGLKTVSDAYIAHFSPRVARESASDTDISPIDPNDLIRFYQAYEISKDTFRENKVSRTISQTIAVPQISATFLALAGLVILLDILGLVNVVWFTIAHFEIAWYTPESKLDWAVQSISEETPATPMSANSHKRFSVTASILSEGHTKMRKANKLRAFFESARYGSHASTETVPLTRYPAPLQPPQQQQYTGSFTRSPDVMSPPEPLYNMSPFEAQFTHDAGGGSNPDYLVSGTRGHIRPWNGGYQRLGRDT